MERREFNRIVIASVVGALASHRLPGLGLAQDRAAGQYSINSERLRASLEALSQFGRLPQGGVTRVAWTQPDIEARRFVMEKLMPDAGLAPRIDAAGSIYGRREGKRKDLPVILFGSHIDSVPEGGIFDGDLGSTAAIEAMRTLRERHLETQHPLECVIWSNEEGVHYGRGLFGSSAAAGVVDPAELELKDERGVSIREAVRAIGGDLSNITQARRKPGEIAAYLELHIEQGGVLDKSGVPIGVVEGIVGVNRYSARITGIANHAGTTPMPDRHDALIAAAHLILAVREEVVREPGRQVGTVGSLSVEPNAPNVVPGKVEMTIELRDLSLDRVNAIFGRIQRRASEIANQTATKIEISHTSTHEPALATPWVREIIAREAEGMGLKTVSMPSGAGHDAQMIARIAPMGMIFVPSAGGISHSTKELTHWQDCANGCEALYRTILAIDRRLASRT